MRREMNISERKGAMTVGLRAANGNGVTGRGERRLSIVKVETGDSNV